MIDDDRLCAPFGLRPLARVVDDERVDVRQGAERRLRVALGGEGEGLAGQPFEVPVCFPMCTTACARARRRSQA